MTSQLLMSTRSSTLSRPESPANASGTKPLSTHSLEAIKCPYQADQQVKFLHLQAEVDSLLLKLQALKQQRLAETAPTSGHPTGNQANN